MIRNIKTCLVLLVLTVSPLFLFSQNLPDSALLTLDRIYHSDEFQQEFQKPIQWIENGDAYIIIERSEKGVLELVRYESSTQKRSKYISSDELVPEGSEEPIEIEDFSLSPDGTKALIFNNSKRVWRKNTKGDYWVYDFSTKSLKQIGRGFPESSLMFAKFSSDNRYVAYVTDFNIYFEDFKTGEITQLTYDGNGQIINGTFDWVYEEEFGCRDGFRWSPGGASIAFWNLDASGTGTFQMINNTDSVYSKVIPLQYPKVGQDPSSCKVGIIKLSNKEIEWIALPGDPRQNYIPGIQWVNDNLILIQQLNRKQNHLRIWSYNTGSKELVEVYDEKEKTWVDIKYPDVSSTNWDDNDLILVDSGKSFLRMTEIDGWRHVYKVEIASGKKVLITSGNYDVASVHATTSKHLYFIASPDNNAQRYLYQVDLAGRAGLKRVTPENFSGINTYNCSPNGKYAVHIHTKALSPKTVSLVSLPGHKTINTFVDNKNFKQKISSLRLPEVSFFKVTTEEGITVDGRMIKPVDFDSTKTYPVLFHVYGEPWGQVATDSWIGMWNIMLAQQGYIIIDMDNRGTPCLKGSNWRKSIYRKVGIINTRDQALAAKEVLKWPFIDKDKTAVWGWSGGGSMTLNLMFQYPEIYKTGMAVAAVANQLTYDNIYQERYMGLPQENLEDFVAGSPITHAKNLRGNLLIVHGTADDNVHYQNAEMLINELIKQNKQFQMMAYPNRSHGIYEGENTSRHLFTLLTNYLMSNVPVKKRDVSSFMKIFKEK